MHLLLSSVSVECTTCDSFLRLFRNYVYYHFIFPKIDKRWVGIRAGGLDNFSKINERGGTIIRYSRVSHQPIIPQFFSLPTMIRPRTNDMFNDRSEPSGYATNKPSFSLKHSFAQEINSA